MTRATRNPVDVLASLAAASGRAIDFPSFADARRYCEDTTMPEFEDKTLTCVDCEQPWTFEAGEQSFFADKGLSQPKRCKPCRQKKREQRDREGGGKRQR